jgi:hypothetical protein
MKLVGLNVPPHRFGRFRWLVPVGVEHPSDWHYGIGQALPHQGSTQVDLSTVDASLRPLVEELHIRQIETLPSCAGHFGRSPERVKQAARDMAAQEGAIRGRGLPMRDIETNAIDLIQADHWRAPSLSELMQGVRRWEGVGYLGVVIPAEKHPFRPLVTRWGRIQPIHGRQSRLDLWVNAPDQSAQDQTWQRMTHMTLDLLDRA